MALFLSPFFADLSKPGSSFKACFQVLRSTQPSPRRRAGVFKIREKLTDIQRLAVCVWGYRTDLRWQIYVGEIPVIPITLRWESI